MSKAGEDLTGRKFGKWTVLKRASKPYYYTCQCACGAVKDVYYNSLLRGVSSCCHSCANSMPNPGISETRLRKAKELYLGQTVNGWKVLEILPTKEGTSRFRCRAVCPVCGHETVTSLSRLKLIRRCADCNQDIGKKVDTIRSVAYSGGSSLISARSRLNGTVNKNSVTGANGVTKRPNGRYFAYINFKRKQYYIGEYDQLEDAIAARKKAEKIIFGQYLDQHAGWEEELKKTLADLKEPKTKK